MATEQDILNDRFVLKLSRKIDPVTVNAGDLSISLGLGGPTGSNAALQGSLMMNPQSAHHNLLKKYVYKHGTGKESALKLRLILREDDIVPAAEMLETELKKRNIEIPDDIVQLDLPSPPTSLPAPPQATKD